jgi:hypothetical protein
MEFVMSINDATIVATEMDRSITQKVLEVLASNHYVRISGLFSESEIKVCRENIQRQFNPKNDKKHDPKDADLLLQNFQKLVVGGTHGINSTPRFLRMFYTPFMDSDQFEMHDVFRRLVVLRNRLYGLPDQFTCQGIEDGMWSALRINHYPRGGGFMAAHSDTGTAEAAKSIGLGIYVQLILIMSKKGVDFQTGGAYIETDEGQRYFYEDECDLGDVVIYDGRVKHGVEEIDYLEPLDLASCDGRYVAMATLFKYFGQNVELEYRKLVN